MRTADADKLIVLFIRRSDWARRRLPQHTPCLLEHPNLSPELEKFLLEHHNVVETKGDIESLRMLAVGHVDYVASNLGPGIQIFRELGLSGKLEPLLSPTVFEAGCRCLFHQGARFTRIGRGLFGGA